MKEMEKKTPVFSSPSPSLPSLSSVKDLRMIKRRQIVFIMTDTQRWDMIDCMIDWMNETRDPFRGYYWARRPWRKNAPAASWAFTNYTRQREEDEKFEPRQLDYLTGLEMRSATRKI